MKLWFDSEKQNMWAFSNHIKNFSKKKWKSQDQTNWVVGSEIIYNTNANVISKERCPSFRKPRKMAKWTEANQNYKIQWIG